MWGKIALRCWIEWMEEGEGKEEWLGLGGEKRTGEEEEQRILLDAGGLAARLKLSSNMDDLFPHTMADMFRCSSALCVSHQPLPPPLLSLLSLHHLLLHAPFLIPDLPEKRPQIPPEKQYLDQIYPLRRVQGANKLRTGREWLFTPPLKERWSGDGESRRRTNQEEAWKRKFVRLIGF